MRKHKKSVSVLLTVLLLLSTMSVAFVEAGALKLTAAEKKIRVYKNFKYETLVINEDEDDTEGLADEKVVQIVGYKGKPVNLTIPAKINGLKVISVQKNAFAKCLSLKTLVMKARADIVDSAFKDCENLTTVDTGKTAYIRDFAFRNCKKLTKVKISKYVKGFYGNAFAGCTALKKFTVASDSTRFKAKDGAVFSKDGTQFIAFPAGKKNRYSIPKGVTRVAIAAFEGYTNMKTIYLGNDVRFIGTRALKGCTNLTTAKVGDYVDVIESRAFMNCTSLEKINLRKVVSIEYEAFKNTGLKYIKIPDKVDSISREAFAKCKKLIDVDLGEETEYIDTKAFAGCTSLTEITMTESMMNFVDDRAFEGCTELKYVSYGEEFSAIFKRAFLNCPGYKRIIIPENVHLIGDKALGYTLKDGVYTKVEGVKIYGYEGSAAETYAKENGFEFQALKKYE